MNKIALCIGGGNEQLDSIAIAKRLGFKVLAIDQNEHCPAEKVADEFYPISTHDEVSVIDIASKKGITLVLPTPIGRYLTTVGAVNDALGLPGVGFYAAEIATNKSAFNHFAKGIGLNVAKQFEFTTNFDNSETYSFPLILKPKFGSGSRGVQIVEDIQELYKVIAENSTLYADGVLLECFILGDDFGADIIVNDFNPEVVCIRQKKLTPLPYRVEYEYTAIQNEEYQMALEEMFHKISMGLSLRNAIIHVDFKVDEHGEIYIIEFSPRPSGLMISSKLVPIATGRNLVQEFIAQVGLKSKIENPKATFRPSILRYFVWPNESLARKVPTADIISKHKDVVIFSPPMSIGLPSTGIKSMSDILQSGHIIVSAKDAKTCRASLDFILNLTLEKKV